MDNIHEIKRKIADECGLVYSGKDAWGEDEFIGTDDKWKNFTKEFDLYLESGRLTEHNA